MAPGAALHDPTVEPSGPGRRSAGPWRPAPLCACAAEDFLRVCDRRTSAQQQKNNREGSVCPPQPDWKLWCTEQLTRGTKH
ncbi:hypothetical protein EYF80_014768 [Liparis tanakae]|uniref:Uncharacterized protein n=1 Tax=Liparis tanakae TaxID=230148 RepID=A0A4Z2IC79_9TELE|nr:hypothetical protein EYF80_014768 [Liparis tanakae]